MDQRSQLNKAGFSWETLSNRFQREWLVQFEKMKAHAQQHNNVRPPDAILREWLNGNRKKNNKGTMKPERKKMLDSMGVHWTTRVP
jgi:hypothetical protein